MAEPDSGAGEPIRPIARALDWLDARPAWQFLLALYVARWLALFPYILLERLLFSTEQLDDAVLDPPPDMSALALFRWLIVSGPIVETLFECAIPYAVFAKVRGYKDQRPARPWGYIVTSALIMTALHPIATALIPALITGAFLAYCYAHFARLGTIHAILATYAFHAAINMVGYAMLATM